MTDLTELIVLEEEGTKSNPDPLGEVIRNPFRGEKAHAGYYMPEYQTLNLEPKVFSVSESDRVEFKKSKENKVKMEVPKQNMVFVGNNSVSWLGDEAPAKNTSPLECNHANETPRGVCSCAPTCYCKQKENTCYTKKVAPKAVNLDYSQLEEGHYGVFIKDKLLIKSPQISSIESHIEDLLFKEEVDVNDIVVVKRLPIKVGVLVGK